MLTSKCRLCGEVERKCEAADAVGALDPGVPYESRWAPYVRVHGPGQGQFPKGSIRPRGYMAPDARRSLAGGNVAVMASKRQRGWAETALVQRKAVSLPSPGGARGERNSLSRSAHKSEANVKRGGVRGAGCARCRLTSPYPAAHSIRGVTMAIYSSNDQGTQVTAASRATSGRRSAPLLAGRYLRPSSLAASFEISIASPPRLPSR